MPTYVLSKVKRTIGGQKVGDLVDQDPPSSEKTSLANADRVPVWANNRWRWFSLKRLSDWLEDHGHPWSRITGKPSSYPASAHTHNAADVNAGTLDAAQIPNIGWGKITGVLVSVAQGGTGHNTARGARANLGLGTIATKNFWTGTKAEYDAITTKDADTIYFTRRG